MKKFKLPLIGLLIAGLLTIAFIGCKKDLRSPLLTSEAKGGTPPPPAFIFNLPTAGVSCVGTDYCFDASFTNNGGNAPGGTFNSITVTVYDVNSAQVGDPQIVEDNTGHFCLSNLAEGNYTVSVKFTHTPSENANPVNATFSFNLAINPEGECGFSCENSGLTLSRTSGVIASDNFTPLSVQVSYIVSNCSSTDYTGLKLQGGLVNKASNITHSQSGDATNVVDNSVFKGNVSNFVISYTFDLAAGKSNTFSATYDVYPFACGGPLTGAWSLKKDGVIVGTIAPATDELGTTGYLDRLYYLCP